MALPLVAREGDTFEVKEGFPATVESTSIGGFNATGQLALNYSFTNGAEAIGIVQVEDVPPLQLLHNQMEPLHSTANRSLFL